MEQLRSMAIHFYRDNHDTFKRFDEVVWMEDIAVKVGGTPLTALLVIAYFEIFGHFDTRYQMYHILVVFILIRVWKRIKEKDFNRDMRTFFKMAKSKTMLEEEKDAVNIYDALGVLAFEHTDLGRVIKEDDILGVFKIFARDSMKGNKNPETEAEKWLKRMQEDHVLVSAGPRDYVFIHSTVMEYLASHFIVEKLGNSTYLESVFPCPNLLENFREKKQTFFDSEILPIAVGSSIGNGAALIRFVGIYMKEMNDKSKTIKFYQLVLKCLAEYESFIDRHYQRKRLSFLHKELEKSIEEHWEEVDWAYQILKNIILDSDEEQLELLGNSLKIISPLSRWFLLEKYIDYNEFASNNTEILSLRKRLLYTIVNRDLVDEWLQKHQEKMVQSLSEDVEEIRGSLVTFDSDGYHPEDKNFNYFQEYSGKELVGFLGSPNFRHKEAVTCVAFSLDGTFIISASKDHTIRLWSSRSGKEFRTLIGHTDIVSCISFSPDGNGMITGSADKTIRLWNISISQDMHRLQAPSAKASGYKGKLKGIIIGKEIACLNGHSAPVSDVKLSPDGNRIISSSIDHTIKLWDITSNKEIFTFKGHNAPVLSVSFSPDGKRFISGSEDHTIKLWDTIKKKEIHTFKRHTGSVCCVRYSPDGKRFISGSTDKTLILWKISDRKILHLFNGHNDAVLHVVFNSKGNHIISSSLDRTIKLWDCLKYEEIRTFHGHMGSVNSVNISRDGHLIISGSNDCKIKLWDARKGNETMIFKGHNALVSSISFSPDGKKIISGSFDTTIKKWNIQDGKEVGILKGHNSPILSVQISPDGNYILSSSIDSSIKLWSMQSSKEIRTLEGHSNAVRCVGFSPASNKVVSCSDDKTIRLWQTHTGKEIFTFKGHESPIFCLKFSKKGEKLISGSADYTIKLWDIDKGKEIKTLKGHTDSIGSICFANDERYVISGSDDHTIKLWDLSTAEEIRTFKGHTSKITGLNIYGRTIVSISDDGSFRVWDLLSGNCIKTIPLLWISRDLQMDPTQPHFYATANSNGTVTFFDMKNSLQDQDSTIDVKDFSFESHNIFYLEETQNILDIEEDHNLLDLDDL